MSKKKNTIYPKVDDQIIWGVLLSIILILCFWLCVMLYHVNQDVKRIKNDLKDISEMLEPIEHISDPKGLILHMKNIDTDISSKQNQ
jgi:hypothetical protein